MLKSLFALVTVACGDADLHLLQMSAARQGATQDPEAYDEDLENDDPEVNTPDLTDDELDNEDDSPEVDDPGFLQEQMVIEDHIALLDFGIDLESDDSEEVDAALPGMNPNGVYPDQRPVLRGSDIRGYLPGVASMAKCQCEGEKRKRIGTASVIYHAGLKRCIFLKASADFNRRMSHKGWSASNQLKCVKTMQWYTVPATCAGKRGFEHAKCTKLRAEAAYTFGSWINGKKCLTTVSTNPKMYDWAKAKDYCLTGNSYCNGIAKLTVKRGRGYVNEYTFCKAWRGRFSTSRLPASWPYGGVLEVRHQPKVELPDDAFSHMR